MWRYAVLVMIGVALMAVAWSSSLAEVVLEPEPEQRVVLVTGSTSGLGREVAYRLAADGAFVIVHGRDVARGEAVMRRINEDMPGAARFIRADFVSLDNVRTLAATVLEDYERLDLLVNNAGIAGPQTRQLSEDGYELTFQVNYLSHFLLTDELLPLLEQSAPARIINVASGAQRPIDFDDPHIKQDYESWRAYGQSKLAQITYTKTLAKRLEGTGVSTYSLHPATFMDTRMVRGAGIEPRTTVDEGADAVMHLITAEGLENGAYYNGLEPDTAHEQAYDKQARQKLWTLSEALLQGNAD